MPNLAGLHDIEAIKITPHDTWVVDTVALSESPSPKTCPANLHVIARLNFGYGSTGTLPPADQYQAFAYDVATYVSGCQNCTRWIIGNEPNLPREWPNGQPIFPAQYAACYKLCRQAIHAQMGHELDEVLIAAPGPWNAELKYPGNPNGDWIQYFKDVIGALGSGIDGFALHAYTHGYDTALVTSTARMNAPFQDRYYEFRTYKDYMWAIPPALHGLSVYITEANGGPGWQAVGLMPAMLAEIDKWNHSLVQPIQALIFYRYPHYDEFYIAGRNDVIAEYQAAVGHGYTSPDALKGTDTMPNSTFIPVVSNGTPSPALPPRLIDQRTIDRGVTVETPALAPGQKFWRAANIQWLDEGQSGGRHHIYGDTYKDGKKTVGIPLKVSWPSGSTDIKTEDKSSDTPPFNFWYNYPMSPSLNEFSIRVDDGTPSETVKGIGMGANGNSHIHTSTIVEWELATMPQAEQPVQPPTVGTGPTEPQPSGDNWARIYAFIRKWEGGWADNPADPGGATNKGITYGTFVNWRTSQGKPTPTRDDLRDISDAETEQIYHDWYYVASGSDKLSWPLSLANTDTAVNAGVGRAQAMLAQSGGDFLSYVGHLIQWYASIPNFETFGRGWMSRRGDLLIEASKP